MRQSVVLTSNFAKSVVNLADVVSTIPIPLSPSPPHTGIQGSLSVTDTPHTHTHTSWKYRSQPPPAPPLSSLWAQIYKEQLNTRIVLVAMETWADGDKIQVQDDLLETLARLMVYRREGLPEPSDATHLFS